MFPQYSFDLETLFELYTEMHAQEDNIIELVVDNYSRCKMGFSYTFWNTHQQTDIMQRFQHILDRKKELLLQLHHSYVNMILMQEDDSDRYALTLEYSAFIEKIQLESPHWLKEMERTLPFVGEITDGEKFIPLFERLHLRIDNHYKNSGTSRLQPNVNSSFKEKSELIFMSNEILFRN